MCEQMTDEWNTSVRPIHYLGSKLRMLESVKEAVDTVDASKGCLCDLFSGSGTVSKYFSEYRDIVAVDIQNYSGVLCEAMMGRLNYVFDINAMMCEIKQSSVRRKQLSIFGELLEYEDTCMEKARNHEISDLYEIIEKGSIYIFIKEGRNDCSEKLNKVLANLKKNISYGSDNELLDSIITRYYGGLYFSYQQALDMDSIEHFVFKLEGLVMIKSLAALLSTASEIVNTVGKQFAQPLKVSDGKGKYKVSLAKKILEDRSMKVFDVYEKWLKFYLSVGET